MAKLSGLQRSVLALYRSCLREIRRKPVESRPNFRRFVRREFQKYVAMDRKDFAAVEYLVRRGQRQLETYSGTDVTNIS